MAFVGGDQVTAGVAVKDESSGGAENSGDAFAVDGADLWDFPGDLAGVDVDGAQKLLAGVIERPEFGGTPFGGHDVIEAGDRAVSGAIPIGGMFGATDVRLLQPDGAAIGADAAGPSKFPHERLGEE